MIILNSLRQQCALLARSYSHIKPSKVQINRCFSIPTLSHHDYFQENGVPGVLSKEGYNRAWTEHQAYLVAKLNSLTAGKRDESKQILNLIFEHARNSNKAALFNYASMTHNNALFFASLSPEETEIPKTLAEYITGSFSSILSFQTTFIATAAAMFGPGFVWLVKQNSGDTVAGQNLRILTTYIAGSPYPRAHWRTQTVDMNTQTTGVHNRMSVSDVANFTAGHFGQQSMYAPNLAPGGVELEVLLGVSTWEHVWLFDHGSAGKQQYLEALWKRIDWNVVNKRAVWSKLPMQGKSRSH